ncbi:hypothetical protein N8T08_009597 [Aspergillus melleus]|uniref:Uncharacterized protein n=1 Tax=Aspergillus melleus TaxID=138277 RepID=A0ACC3ATL1_9EURO|nr:hypothetical protein N8T08_009597 [Aspergillus melleus]
MPSGDQHALSRPKLAIISTKGARVTSGLAEAASEIKRICTMEKSTQLDRRLWRSTDLEAVRSLVSEREIRFEGALAYNDSGQLVREPSPRGDEWIGPPTPQMDALWDRVEAGSIILLDGTEADIVREKTTLFDGYWVTGLDVIHQLHCLNKVRKALYPEYYKPDQSAGTEILHVDIRSGLRNQAYVSGLRRTAAVVSSEDDRRS